MSADHKPQVAQTAAGGFRQALRLLLTMLNAAERNKLYVLAGFIASAGIFEALSVAAIFPLVTQLLEKNTAAQWPQLIALKQWLGIASDTRFQVLIAMLFGGLLLLGVLLRAASNYAIVILARNVNIDWTNRLTASYLQRDYAWYLQQHSAELSRSTLKSVQDAISGVLVPLLALVPSAFVSLLLAFILLSTLPAMAAVIAIVLAVVYGLLYVRIRRRMDSLARALLDADQQRHRLAIEVFGGIKDVKVFHLETHYGKRLAQQFANYANAMAQSALFQQLPRYILEAVAFVALTLMMAYLFSTSSQPERAMALLSLFGFAALRMLPALQNCYQYLISIRTHFPSLAWLHQHIQDAELAPSTPTNLVPLALQQSLRVDGLQFRYAKQSPDTLASIDLEIKAGQTIAIVGSSGSGKTTLIDVIMGLLPANAGQIVVDDTVISASNTRAWQANIGYIPQHIFLSDSSIASNIALGLAVNDIDLQRVKRAAKIAALDDFIEQQTPHSYQTQVGERGVRLSGGQRQRIGIARALYRDPQVLICDEATSALDNQTESEVMQAIAALRGDKTIIIIAHRLSTIAHCDCIYFLSRGRLIAQGSYQELLRDCEAFRAFAQSETIEK